jgi:hypothetical protein
MLILLITPRNKQERPVADSDDDSFRRHNEAMKQFRRAHPDLNTVSNRDILTADGDLLATVSGTRLDDNSRN